MPDDRPGTQAVETPALAIIEGGPSLAVASVPAIRRPVVVVDDDPAIVARIARILAEAGYPTITATGGRSALRQVFGSSLAPMLLVCAIEMPEMSGIELAARLTATRPGVRILLISADPRSVERAREHLPLVHGVLLKPFSPAELAEAIASALAHEL